MIRYKAATNMAIIEIDIAVYLPVSSGAPVYIMTLPNSIARKAATERRTALGGTRLAICGLARWTARGWDGGRGIARPEPSLTAKIRSWNNY
jgi:hypothetical protein